MATPETRFLQETGFLILRDLGWDRGEHNFLCCPIDSVVPVILSEIAYSKTSRTLTNDPDSSFRDRYIQNDSPALFFVHSVESTRPQLMENPL